MKKGKNYLLFSVLILSLVSIIFLAGSEDVTVDKNVPVFSVESANIASIILRMAGREIRIEKAGAWVMEGEEAESVVDETLMDDILDDLMEMVKGSTVTSLSNVDPGEFGFNDPFMTMTLGFRERPAETLIIGATHPNGQAYYAVMKGHEEIFLVGSVYPKVVSIRLRKLIKETENFQENLKNGHSPQSGVFDPARILYS